MSWHLSINWLENKMEYWIVNNSNRLKRIIGRLSPEDGKYICRIIYKDPFTDIYSILLIFYVIILGGFLLWPFDFAQLVRNDTRWLENSKGVEFLKMGQAMSNSSTQEFFDRLVNGKGLTLEVWLQTEDLNQHGPAKILSYSVNTGLSNFTLGQSWDKLVVRFRTTKTSLNGTTPHIVIIDTFNHRDIQHMVITYDFSEQRVYINGEQRARSNVLKGNFSNWDRSCRLVIGNEVTGNWPWKGKVYYVAIFDRPLAEQEIRQDYLSGLPHKTNSCPQILWRKGNIKHTDSKAKGPVARYFFDEEKGDVIHDSGLVSNALNLFIPKYIKHRKELFFTFSIGSLKSKSKFSDIILNILIFIPLGILIHGMLRIRYGLTLKISLVTLLVGTLFTLGVESIQHFSMTRESSLIDVSANMIGIAISIVIDRFYNLFLNYQANRLQMLLYDRTE